MLDSHAHILSRDTVSYPPIDPSPEKLAYLHTHGFDAADLCAAMDESGVDQALIVQRAQFYGADNNYVCSAAAASGGRLKAICGIDSRLADAEEQARNWLDRGAVGIRLMARPQERTLDWLAGEAAHPLWRLCAERDTPLCVHLFPANREAGLARLATMLDHYPLRWLVIDHLGNPEIDTAQSAGIDDAMCRLAGRPNVALKFTTIPLGRLAEQGIDGGEVIAAYVALFGPERLIWGSDITQSPGTYAGMVALARQATAGLPAATQAGLLGDNSRRIYGWG